MRATLCVLGLIVAAAASAQAQDIAGTYTVEGTNPGGQGRYAGEAKVEATGPTYQVTWTIGSQAQHGTGLLRDGHFAVVYLVQGQPPGVAAYAVQPDGTLDGTWTGLGGAVVGQEVWRRK